MRLIFERAVFVDAFSYPVVGFPPPLVSITREPTPIAGGWLVSILLTIWLPAYINISPLRRNHRFRQFRRFPILVIYPDMTTFDPSGPPILGDMDGCMPGGDGTANVRCAFGEASSDSDEVMGCSAREGGEGVRAAVAAGMRGRPGIGIGGEDEVRRGVAVAALASC